MTSMRSWSRSELRRTGDFSLLGRDAEPAAPNVVWGMRGNFLDVPTDCPQRDERLGWTGDLAVFAPTAAYLYDVRTSSRDWWPTSPWSSSTHDGRSRTSYRRLEASAPAELPAKDGDRDLERRRVWVPWALWQAYGDPAVLSRPRAP